MQIIEKGHTYILEDFDGTSPSQQIMFVKKADTDNGFETVQSGTTNEEVISVLIDRIQYLNEKQPCRENSLVITKLEEALMWLERRTTDRKERGVENTSQA